MPVRNIDPAKIVSVTAAGAAAYVNAGMTITLTGIRNIASCIGIYSDDATRVYHVRGITAPNQVIVVAMVLNNGAASVQVAADVNLSGVTLTFVVEKGE